MEEPQVYKTPRLKSIQRVALENSAIESLSPLRRSSRHENESGFLNYTSDDDELERRKRRSLVQIRRNIDRISEQNSSPVRSEKSYDQKDAKNHYQNFLKLFIDNKINKTNAWNLKIVNVTRDVCRTADTFEALQNGANCLDICAKVYGLRVDSVYENGNRLISKALSSDKPNHVDENPPENNDGENSRDEPAEKAPKTKRMIDETKEIVVEEDELDTLVETGEIAYESVTFQLKTDFHSNPIRNLFTNVLRMDNLMIKFDLFSDSLWMSEPSPLENDEESIEFPEIFKIDETFKIADTLDNFCVDEWDPEEELRKLADGTLIENSEPVFDNDGIPIHELDGPLEEPIIADVDGDSDKENNLPDITRHEIVSVQPTDSLFHESIAPLRMGNGNLIEKLWAGPSHWKAKHVKPAKQYCVVGEVQQKKKYKRKLCEPLDFDFISNYELDVDVLNTKCKIKKRNQLYTTKHLLPVPDWSLEFLNQTLKNFMLKPTTALIPKKTIEANNNDDYEVAEYKYENPNDSFYCSQNSAQQLDDFVEEYGCENANDENLVNFEENLIEQPDMVNVEIMPFAMRAKKINISKLKDNVKQQLDNRNELTFNEMYRNLENTVPTQTRNELSVHLAFVALLHLCNEENLILKQIENTNKDFLITKLAKKL